jgi:hypothetical protein
VDTSRSSVSDSLEKSRESRRCRSSMALRILKIAELLRKQT